ncbi:MAG: DUF2779 domain-containing protein [Nitrospiria bacterium]
MANTTITKTRFMAGLQCQKNLYLSVFNKVLAAPIDPETQIRFDDGKLVGLEAQKRFPGGHLVDVPNYSPDKAVQTTRELINQEITTLYEPAFTYNGLLIRVDILHRETTNSHWQLYEVKSSTSVKDEHLFDLAFQFYVLKKSGLFIQAGHLMFINNKCFYPDLENLFVVQDLTEKLEPLFPIIEDNLDQFKRLLSQSSAPEMEIGPQCTTPYECLFKAHCWSRYNLPNPGVMNLYKIGDKKFQFLKEGIKELTDPNLPELRGIQKRMVDVAKSGQPYINRKGIGEAIREWQYPFYFFDFETIDFAIPRYIGTSPYQQIPFQFSCDILENETAEMIHFEYLHDSSFDPREEVVSNVLRVIGLSGSVFSYNQQFENRMLGDLAAEFPHNADRLKNIQTRLVDPLPVIRENVYFHEFAGSFSLKKVAPAVLGSQYQYSGEVKNGTDAQIGYLRFTAQEISHAEKESLRNALLAYCAQDTRVLALLVKWLFTYAK